jgi:hypothetical protein
MAQTRKSSFCTKHACCCVEVVSDSFKADLPGGHEVASAAPQGGVMVRNSENPEHVVPFTADEWRVFLKGVKAGEFDLPDSDE